MAGVIPRLRVFISSAQGGLMPYREAAVDVCRRLGHEPVFMEDLVPERTTPATWSRDRVLDCDAYLLLLAHRYGTAVPGHEWSYTELEYDAALSVPEMPVMVWTVDPDWPWVPSDIDHGDQKERLDALKSRASEHVRGTFGDIAKFREDVLVALRALRPRERGPESSDPPSLRATTSITRAPDPFAKPAYVGSLEFQGRAREMDWLDEWAVSSDPVAVVEAIGGTGKSALTWEWFQERAARAVPGLAGRFWWSLYDPANTIEEFQRTFLVYASGCSWQHARELGEAELEAAVLAHLEEAPHVVVLDGVERLLNAYHRFEAGTVSEAEVESLQVHHARAVADARVHAFLRRLAALTRSRVLVSTRLLPDSFVGYGDILLPGVRQLDLRGLRSEDALRLLAARGIRGSDRREVKAFLDRLDNHPLLIGVVIGMVRRYRAAPGDFAAWLADPAAGGAFRVADAAVTDRSHHILEQALAGLDRPTLQLLQRLAVPVAETTWEMVKAINPFRTDLPGLPPEFADLPTYVVEFLMRRRQALREARGEGDGAALTKLDAALQELQDRGLLWWNTESNTYDLHPVVRAYTADTTADDERRATNETLVRDHFGRLRNPENPATAQSITDLLYTVMFFHALAGSGDLEQADRLWAQMLSDALVWRMGNHLLVVGLLTPHVERARQAGFDTRVEWDLAIAQGGLGMYEEALELEVRILRAKIEQEAPPAVVMAALNNVMAGLDLLNRSAELGRCRWLLRDLTEAAGNPQSDVARLAHSAAARLLAERDYADALDAVERLEAGPRNELDPGWDWELSSLRLCALVGLGRLDEVGPVSVDQNRFGTAWRARLGWCDFVLDYARERDDPALALEAARERERVCRFLAREPVPAAVARALVECGEHDEAARVLDAALVRFERVPFSRRPFRDAAIALRALGRVDEARELALDAYRQAWEDGPTTHCRADVAEARALLDELGVEPPELPDIDPSSVTLPFEEQLLAYVERLRSAAIED